MVEMLIILNKLIVQTNVEVTGFSLWRSNKHGNTDTYINTHVLQRQTHEHINTHR